MRIIMALMTLAMVFTAGQGCGTIQPAGRFCTSRPKLAQRLESKSLPCLEKDLDPVTKKRKHSTVSYNDTDGWFIIEPNEYKAQIKAAEKNQ